VSVLSIFGLFRLIVTKDGVVCKVLSIFCLFRFHCCLLTPGDININFFLFNNLFIQARSSTNDRYTKLNYHPASPQANEGIPDLETRMLEL
jgi:hypothetical protein